MEDQDEAPGQGLEDHGQDTAVANDVVPTVAEKRLRPARSHPSMAMMPASASGNQHRSSLRELPGRRSSRHSISNNNNKNNNSIVLSNFSSDSSFTDKSQEEEELPQKRMAEEDNEEIGGHDTITSLAGVKVLQKYRKAMARPAEFRGSSLSRGESLEDIKESDDDDEKEALIASSVPVDVFVPPDGAYGWVVAFGAFLALFFSSGLVKSYGIILGEVLKYFPESSITMITWIPASMTSLALAMAPLASALCQRFNCRYVTLAGACISAFGISLSSIAPNVECLFLTLGIITGIGVGLSTTPGIILTARYFDKNRAKANAFCLSGSAAGSFTFPHLLEFFLSQYGFRGGVLLLGACMLHLFISAAMLRPLAVHVRIVRNERKRLIRRKKQVIQDDKVPPYSEVVPPHSCNRFVHPMVSVDVEYHENPDDMIIALRKKLNSLESGYHDRATEENRGDDTISTASSCQHLQPLGHGRSAHACSMPLRRNDSGCSHLSSACSTSRDSLVWNHGDSSNTAAGPRRMGASDSYLVCPDAPRNIQKAKALSLRELYIHQLSSSINLYKAKLFAPNDDGRNKRSSRKSLNSNSNCPPPVVVIDRKEVESKAVTSSRFTLMFSLEDLTTDSTGILKDSRYAAHDRSKELPPMISSGRRVVNLDRSVSENHPRHSCSSIHSSSRRIRYYSEGNEEGKATQPSRFKLTSHVAEDAKGVEEEALKKNEEIAPEQCQPEKKSQLSSIIRSFTKYCDVSIIKEPAFIIMTLSVMAMAVGVPHVLFFLPVHAVTVGAEHSPSFLLSVSAIFDLAGRLTSGFLVDLKVIPLHLLYSAAMLLSGISVLCIPLATSVTTLTVFASFYGLAAGMWMVMVPLSLSEYLGVERIGTSYGLVRFFQSGANLVGPILGGYLWEATGSLFVTFYFLGAVMSVGSLIALLQPIANAKGKKTTSVEEAIET